jgi:signal transduction histidine kinase
LQVFIRSAETAGPAHRHQEQSVRKAKKAWHAVCFILYQRKKEYRFLKKENNMANKKILIADDEDQTCFCISVALKMKGYSTVIAHNGQKALQIIEESSISPEPIDLLVCDIQMPEINGEDLIDRLNELKIKIPTLVITGYGEKDLVVRLMRKGCRDFIDKPFEPVEIEKRISLILAEEESVLLEKKRMESLANAGLKTRQFVHDINNVLAGAQGYADMALDAIDNGNPSFEYLTKIVKTTSRAAEICKTLLATSKSKDPPAFVPTEMNSLAQRAAAILKDVVPKNISIEIKTDSTPLWCSVNAERVQQALLNLGINAGQAMKDGGNLALSCKSMEKNGSNIVRITVSDSGCGIPKENLKNIFKDGFSTKKDGNGIGLHTVKEIVEEHGGSIMVASELNKGTTFTIDFLAQEKTESQPNERTFAHENV